MSHKTQKVFGIEDLINEAVAEEPLRYLSSLPDVILQLRGKLLRIHLREDGCARPRPAQLTGSFLLSLSIYCHSGKPAVKAVTHTADIPVQNIPPDNSHTPNSCRLKEGTGDRIGGVPCRHIESALEE
eukprot:CAMPEP_0170604400 /NCGR_PEP_ID=MMETSP0224-20130122/19402_1 /TAXON_ID=285029 /ORGANISM="Togula jolla, Strain CCCM 725" /LENGTH=127 /DNA_ID=CAMNT_0010929299 /DNA_START=243 /DNA_END=626 /DNA_ORIENTATION=-